jgi:hypothetical protein
VVIQGNLVVNGNMTYINSNNITTNDLTINMANNAATATAANGGGIGVGPAGSEYISLTYNSASNIWVASNGLSVQGAIQAQANISGANIITGGLVTATGNVYGNVFTGNGAGLTSLTGANVTGTVPAATVAGTVTTNAQPNITSVGTLSSLSVTANVTSGNVTTVTVSATGNAYAANFVTANTVVNNGVSTSGNVISNYIQANAGLLTGTLSLTGNISGGNISTAGNVQATYFIGDGSKLTGIAPTVQVYEFANIITTGGYYEAVWLGNYVANTVTTVSQTVTTTPTLLAAFLTESGYPNLTVLPIGAVAVAFETQKASGPQGYYCYAEFWKRTSGGVETLLFTSDVTSTSQVNTTVQQQVTYYNPTNVTLAQTDRILTKVYAVMISGSQSISISFDNNTNSGLQLPALPPSAAQFVPYNNATANINLGAYGLTAAFASVTGNLNANNITAIANLQANTITTAGAGNLTINPGLGGIAVIDATGNLLVANTAAATSTTTGGATFAGGIGVAGNVFAGGNVYGGNVSTAGNVVANNVSATLVAGTLTTAAQPNITSVGTLTTVTVTGNTQSGNLLTAGYISATGNIQGNVFTGNGAGLTNINAGNIIGSYGNANVAEYLPTYSGVLTAVGNIISSGNITGANFLTSGLISTSGNITGNNLSATLVTGTLTTAAQPNITSVGTLSSLSVTANITGGNLITTGTASIGGFTIGANTITSQGPTLTIDPNAAGGIDGEVVIQGNLVVNGNMTYINSNNITTNDLTINMANNAATATAANGGGIGVGPAGSEYISLTYNSASNIWVASNGLSVQGAVQALANISAANIVTGGLVTATGNVYGNVFVGNGAGLTSLTGANVTGTVANATYAASAGSAVGTAATVTTAAQPNITSVGTLTSLTVTGNVTGGNIITSGSGGDISGSGNITGGNLLTGGSLSVGGVITVASTAGNVVSTTGNIAGGYIYGNGALLTGVITSVANINNGNTNVTAYANGNVAVTVAGVANTVVFTPTKTLSTVDFSTTGNITTHDFYVGGNIYATDFIRTFGSMSASGNVSTGGFVSAIGNISGNYFIGNGSQLTGITTSSGNSIGNVGNCSVVANTPDGNVNISADGVANLATFNMGTMTMLGAYANPNYIDFNVSVVGNVNGMMVGPIAFGPTGNIQVPNNSRIVIL